MPSLCICFHMHKPEHLRPFSFFDMVSERELENTALNEAEIHRIADTQYLPFLQKLRKLTQQHKGLFKTSFYLSGILMDRFAQVRPDVIDAFAKLVWAGGIEFVGGTHYHAKAYAHSAAEFERQVKLHAARIRKHFDLHPLVFVYPELHYYEKMVQLIGDKMGFSGYICDIAAEKLKGHTPYYLYNSPYNTKTSIILRDHAFEPDFLRLFAPTADYLPRDFVKRLRAETNKDQNVMLYVDFENFIQQNENTETLLNDFEVLTNEVLRHPDVYFFTPSMVVSRFKPLEKIPHLSPTNGQSSGYYQQEVVAKIYEMEAAVLQFGDDALIHQWSKLQCADYLTLLDPQTHGKMIVDNAYMTLMRMLTRFELLLNLRITG